MSTVLVSRDGPVATVTLNRPDKRNALDLDLLEALSTAVVSVENDPAQRILVLRGAGAVFCAGLDLAEGHRPEFARRSPELLARALETLSSTRLITLAAVQGAALAGGAGLMSACDFVVATRGTKFGYPEIRRGLVPALIMTLLRRQLRERDARELLLLGKMFDATHAHAIGLINRVVPDEPALEIEVRSIVNSLLQGAPLALAETKRLLAELWPATTAHDFDTALQHQRAANDSAEVQEGLAAFTEKRAPRWAP